MYKALYWASRVLAILLIIFVSIFALDALSEPRWFLALTMQLIPSFILIILTVVAWKYARAGGILFLVAGLVLILFTHLADLIIFIPVIVVGILFLVESYLLKKPVESGTNNL